MGRGEKPLVEDLADVLAHMVVGWEHDLGFDLAKHPEVVRVMARYRREHLGQSDLNDRSYIELEGEGAERAAEILRRRGRAQ